MNKLLTNFRILTQEAKDAMTTRLAEKSMLDFVEQAKAQGEASGTFKIIISTEDIDRHGETILIDGWDTSFFESNPVVLWAHDYSALPIGMATKVYKEGKNLIAEGVFAPAEANPVGQQVRNLYDAGMLSATSIGCIVKEQDGNVITKAELLEFSFVPVPANPYALRLNELGMDQKELVQKGILTEEKDGDPTEKPTEEPPKEKPPEPAEKGDAAEMIGMHMTQMQAKIDQIIVETSTAMLSEVGGGDKPAEPEEEPAPTEEEKKSVQKAGRVLSQKNRDLIKQAIEPMKASIAALEALLEATNPQGDESQSSDDGDETKNKRSKVAGSAIEQAMDAWMFDRQVLRIVNTATSEALAEFNKKEKGSRSK